MNERTLFMAALEKEDAAQRQAYLDEACAGDAVLRERVETLLRSHQREGQFLDVPAALQLATAGVTRAETPPAADDVPSLAFLAPSDRPGSLGRLGHYEVQEVIGHGGMGIVLRAFDEELHRIVAIKVMAAQLATSATARKRFKREAQAAAAVSHDHIVTIHAVQDAGELPYLVMQYVAGASLQERLDRDGPLRLDEILRIGMQTASGLAAAHAQGLVHRDIKPANILLENGVERVKITDFGLARAAADASVTHSGIIAGTPQYMAPEQAKGEAVDGRADLFSLGSVLYAMCTGRAPFRASGTVAVLKRVCEEMPTPIRDANPEIPEWLVAIIDKLHAKDPAERFQSAAEVAELLSRHLAHVQHPSVVGQVVNLPSVGQASRLPAVSKAGGTPAPRQSGWAAIAAAAVLLCLLGGLSLTEATGVTNLRATVIRIFTPDGTLVVETDDSAVKVTVEGDGGLVITGAGLEEIRLRPGSYRVHADRGGKPVPLDKDLVTVARGGRAIVKVRVEAASVIAAAMAEKGAFVLLAGAGVTERKFDTLAEAVQSASDGDTIEIRGNGPFVMPPIVIHQSLAIRAGKGFWPVIRLQPGAPGDDYLITAYAPLVLEGLEIREVSAKRSQPALVGRSLILCDAKSLHVANCRLEQEEPTHEDIDLVLSHSTTVLRNCQFRNANAHYVSFGNDAPARIVMDNCLGAGGGAVFLHYAHASHEARLEFRRNTLVTQLGAEMGFSVVPDPVLDSAEEKRIQFDASDNVFDARLGMFQIGSIAANMNWQEAGDAETAFAPLIGWREQRNVYSPSATAIFWSPKRSVSLPLAAASLRDWKRRWGQSNSGSIEGPVRLQGGDLLVKSAAAPEKITPEDFRLRSDSAGYRAGKDGKDLGADVDLVGPGAAYERWKKTAEYQEWLKDTGQLKERGTVKPETGAFVLQGGKGVAERKFDTLTEAVASSSDGDTIEVRGNGPFVSRPITLAGRALTIRAGANFRPVLRVAPEAAEGDAAFFVTDAPLVMEGLEFQSAEPKTFDGRARAFIEANPPCPSLHVANCRFATPARISIFLSRTMRDLVVRNCEFACSQGGSVAGHFSGRWVVDNCLHASNVPLVWHYSDPDVAGVSLHVTRNTFASIYPIWVSLDFGPRSPPADAARKPIRLEAKSNIFNGTAALLLDQHPDAFQREGKPRSPEDAVALLTEHLDWRGQNNVYSVGERYLVTSVDGEVNPPHGPKALETWKMLWGDSEADSAESPARYQGGDLLAKVKLSPEKVSPDDFRLRSDSAGYRAGPDGKDLGADVDLVGPGPAYERWKKTPEYEEWLKETHQISNP